MHSPGMVPRAFRHPSTLCQQSVISSTRTHGYPVRYPCIYASFIHQSIHSSGTVPCCHPDILLTYLSTDSHFMRPHRGAHSRTSLYLRFLNPSVHPRCHPLPVVNHQCRYSFRHLPHTRNLNHQSTTHPLFTHPVIFHPIQTSIHLSILHPHMHLSTRLHLNPPRVHHLSTPPPLYRTHILANQVASRTPSHPTDNPRSWPAIYLFTSRICLSVSLTN